jgi:transposase
MASTPTARLTVLRKTVGRGALLELMAQLPRCLIGMEACSEAHQLARDLQPLGHQPRIMMPKFIIPYQRNQKNDGNDAEAICEAVARPNMRFAPIKSVERQVLHEVNARSRALDEDILAYDRRISAQARDSAAMQRIVAVCGVGPVTASAVVASVGDAKLFRNGRQFAAWLGLVGWGWCRGSSPPAASRCSGASTGRAMCTCARC